MARPEGDGSWPRARGPGRGSSPSTTHSLPKTGHAFLDDHDDDAVPLFFRLANRGVNGGYHEATARDAGRRTVAFFDTHLRGS